METQGTFNTVRFYETLLCVDQVEAGQAAGVEDGSQ